ncbi:hypothetical protein P5673_026635 [Acropora cervicornis]|uniref:Uncharacterized protein n=1 Tax=Acropora cervicornis TaxID=6130 RepID=A0AAD9UW95_ACRCE|nr:hypothetical protein P5673_026635 [Acropora cervicornis]
MAPKFQIENCGTVEFRIPGYPGPSKERSTEVRLMQVSLVYVLSVLIISAMSDEQSTSQQGRKDIAFKTQALHSSERNLIVT